MKDKLMHIYYGFGKGKTTAAVGAAYRYANRGNKVLFTSFLKGRNSGEFLGQGPFVVDEFDFCDKFWNEMDDYQKKCANKEIKERLLSLRDSAVKYDMIILDEFLDAVTLGCIECDDAVCFLKDIYSKCEIIITGHKAVDDIFSMADYITEMRKEKHPYDKGIAARCGIEF